MSAIGATYKLRKAIACVRCGAEMAKGETANVTVDSRTGARSGHRHVVCPAAVAKAEPPVSEQVLKHGEEPDFDEAYRNHLAVLKEAGHG